MIRATAFALPLKGESVHCIVTSPPYWGLRKYAGLGDVHFGLEKTIEEYIENSMKVLDECWRVLRDDGTMWWNLGDSYATHARKTSGQFGKEIIDGFDDVFRQKKTPAAELGLKELDRCGVPERFVLAAQKRGWYWRDTICWQKPNPMPESQSSPRWERHRVKIDGGNRGREAQRVGSFAERPQQDHNGKEFLPSAKWQDCPGCPKCSPNGGLVLRWGAWRCTDSFEYIFFLTKTDKYWSDQEAVRERYEKPLDRWGGQELKTPPEGFYILDGDPYAVMKRDRDMRPNSSGRNLRNVWTFPTQPYSGAHFATFPEELPRRCILAGCPEKVCAKCGAGWVRILSNRTAPLEVYTGSIKPEEINPVGNHKQGIGQKYQNWIEENPTKTLGWKPVCDCNAGTARGVCLDPFAGSFTVCDVAMRSGRIGIGVELSKEYIALGKKRTEQSRLQGNLI